MDRRCWGSKTDKKWGIGKGSNSRKGGMVDGGWVGGVTEDKRHKVEKSSFGDGQTALYVIIAFAWLPLQLQFRRHFFTKRQKTPRP